jgi:hypothetical protein
MNTPLSVVKKSAHLIKIWRRYLIFFGIMSFGSSSIISYRAEKQSRTKLCARRHSSINTAVMGTARKKKYFFIMISLSLPV